MLWSMPTGKVSTPSARDPGDFPVGLTLSMTDYQLQPGGEEWLERIRRPSEDVFLEATEGDDFIGVQTYTRMRVGPDGALGGEEGVPVTQMGYEFWPEALEGTIRRAWDKTGGLPVYVTENGIGTADDVARIDYVGRALHGVGRCLDDRDRCARVLLLEPAGQLRVGARLWPDLRHGRRGPGRPSSADRSRAPRGSGLLPVPMRCECDGQAVEPGAN